MFERYTESARRVIFFARYEASQFGSDLIESEHLLLGLFREDAARLRRLIPKLVPESVRKQIEAQNPEPKRVATSVDLPLSEEAKGVLTDAAEEADRLGDHHIGTEHMLLGLLRQEESWAARLLQERDAKPGDLRVQIAKNPNRAPGSRRIFPVHAKTLRSNIEDTVEIHGAAWKVDYVHDVVVRLREYSWHWHKSPWKPRDIVIARNQSTISFDLALAEDAKNFELVKAGWKKDHCAICRWELIESTTDAAHGEGYTTGRDWLCTECYEKFWGEPGFFKSPYTEIT